MVSYSSKFLGIIILFLISFSSCNTSISLSKRKYMKGVHLNIINNKASIRPKNLRKPLIHKIIADNHISLEKEIISNRQPLVFSTESRIEKIITTPSKNILSYQKTRKEFINIENRSVTSVTNEFPRGRAIGVSE